jgi:phosphate transport system substrate-binding protein
MTPRIRRLMVGWNLVLIAAVAGCPQSGPTGGDKDGKKKSAGEQKTIEVDGSSTVYLITEAMAKNFMKQHPDVKIGVGISGTGGGFQKFARGETDISNASRAIRPGEAEACKKAGIDYLELQVAWDGLTVVIHPENNWAEKMTVEQLRKIWRPDNPAKKWSDVDPSWPKEEIKLFGAGTKSGTFDFFTEAVNGKEKVSRPDYQQSEDDNVTVRGVAGNKYALGYFGLAYYEQNKEKLKAVAIAPEDGADHVLPSETTVFEGTYRPLSRPLYIYVKKSSLDRKAVRDFVNFYLSHPDLVKESSYIPMARSLQNEMQERYEEVVKKITGGK